MFNNFFFHFSGKNGVVMRSLGNKNNKIKKTTKKFTFPYYTHEYREKKMCSVDNYENE